MRSVGKAVLQAAVVVAGLGWATGADAAATLNLTAVIRDFSSTHPDFEFNVGDDLAIVGDPATPSLPGALIGFGRKPVYTGGAGTATTTGAANFGQWYSDVPGVNFTFFTTLVATETSPGSGVFQYSNTSYFPLDGCALGPCWGEEGEAHNFWFTTEIHGDFTYQAGTGQIFEFTGDDDVFAYINDQLVVDLGGVHTAQTATVNLDTIATSLGLVDGQDYTFDFFHAERHTHESNFTFTTSLLLETFTVPEPMSLALFGAGLAGLGLMRRRRAA